MKQLLLRSEEEYKMKKEELLIKKFEEDIKKWDLQIAEIEKKMDVSDGQEKKDYENEIYKLSAKISEAKKEIGKLKKKSGDLIINYLNY
jgi:predicted  nucleic acid-binding Zn-ribbon protein